MTTMKPQLALILLLACASTPLAAQQSPLPEWEKLSAQQRDALLAPTRERWNAAPPEQRQRMYERATRWQALTPEQRQQARTGMHRFENMSPQQREQTRVLFQQMRQMTPAQREQLRQQWRQMTPQQRKDWVERHRDQAAPAR